LVVALSKKRISDPGAERLKSIEKTIGPKLRQAGLLAFCASLLAIGQSLLVGMSFGALVTQSVPYLTAAVVLVLYLGLGFLRHGLDALGGRIAFVAAQKVIAAERRTLLERESLVSPLSGDGFSSALGAQLIANKLDLLSPYLARYHSAAFKTRTVPLVILAITACYSWVAVLIFIVAGPLIPVFMALIGFAARDASLKHLKETGTLNALLLERLNALVDIKLLDGRDVMVRQFFDTADGLRQRTMAVLKIAFLSSTVLELFSAIGIAMVAVYVGFTLLGSLNFGTYGMPLTASGGIFLLLLAPDFFAPLRDLASAWHDRASALAVAEELAELEAKSRRFMLGSGAVTPMPMPMPMLAGPVYIKASGLCYVRPDGGMIHYPDCHIRAGESVAVTGASGIGKSTFLALVAGLVQPTYGKIEVAGALLDEDSADSWRTRLSWVSQTPHFHAGSLRANIIGLDGAFDQQRWNAALATVGLDALVAQLPHGDLTRLGENGSGFSGGEARRLMLARALYADADVVLVDEPTADLDADNAQRVMDSLLALARRGKTLIVATHDARLVAKLGREIKLGVKPLLEEVA
jgi:ATP-binding cassette, subfamily C, bacterial CydD